MSQATFSIANQSGASYRTAVNAALQAQTSGNSGATAPATTYPYMAWIDTSTSPAVVKQRDAANSLWRSIGEIDSSGVRPYYNGTVLGTASTKSTGTTNGTVPVLTTNDALPAVSARNLKENRSPVLLESQIVAPATSEVDNYIFQSLGSYDQLLIECIGIGVDQDNADVVLELYDDTTLYGEVGTGSRFCYTGQWRRGANAFEAFHQSEDFYPCNPVNYLFNSYDGGGHQSSFTSCMLVTNMTTPFVGGDAHLRWPQIQHIYGQCIYDDPPGGDTATATCMGFSGFLQEDVIIDGVKLRLFPTTDHFHNGLIRIWGLSSGLWGASKRPLFF